MMKIVFCFIFLTSCVSSINQQRISSSIRASSYDAMSFFEERHGDAIMSKILHISEKIQSRRERCEEFNRFIMNLTELQCAIFGFSYAAQEFQKALDESETIDEQQFILLISAASDLLARIIELWDEVFNFQNISQSILRSSELIRRTVEDNDISLMTINFRCG